MRKMLLALVLVLVVSSFAFAAHVDPYLGQFGPKDHVQVIVSMVPGAKHVDVNAMGGSLRHSFGVINGFSAELPMAAVTALSNNPNVQSIAYNHTVQALLNVAVPTVNADDNWATGLTGAGTTIAVVDTGIYPHVDFGSRIIAFKDFVGTKTSPYDDHGHGTHCAGIVGGNGATYKGPSYEANLIGVKVLNRQGSGTWDQIIAGIDWCVTNKNTYGIDVVSMSLGGTVTMSSANDPVCQAVKNAWNAGLVVVIAAGNSGPSAYTILSPGNEPTIITVAASNDNGTTSTSDDSIASFSSRGPTSYDGHTKPDVAAPGYYITACDNRSTGYVTMSGTSMATPLVAGVVGQMLQANPNMTPNQVKTALMNTANAISGYGVYDQGAGLIDAYAAAN